jgi:SSS family solute:Na+ symporter
MIPVIVVLIYLVIIAYIGSVAYRRSKENTEDFFLASRSIGSLVFFLSLFATNMTAFAILGSSGMAYKRGIGVFGLMASSSAIVIPLSIFFIGTRLWAVGKKFGHMTQVQYFRDRWECSNIGTVIFGLSAIMLVPYMIVSIMGGGTVLAEISTRVPGGAPLIPYWLGCLIVALVVTINVFFGGMRGIVWVNVFQTILFLLFGVVAVMVISHNLPGGYGALFSKMATTRAGALLARDRIPQEEFWSYTFIPLSSIMFPHMAMMCLSAKKMSAFKNTVIAYPIAIMAVWLPCVFLGVVGAAVIPGLQNSDGILLQLLTKFAPVWLAGILGAGIISAVMGSDCHQVLAMSTMFTKDVFGYYGGLQKYGEKGSVFFARAFVLVVTIIAYVIALSQVPIFDLAVRFAFSGFAAMAPIMVAALFWKRSTKWGALASTIWVGVCLAATWYLQSASDPIGNDLAAKAAAAARAGAARPGGAPSGGPRAPGAGTATSAGGQAAAGPHLGKPGAPGGQPSPDDAQPAAEQASARPGAGNPAAASGQPGAGAGLPAGGQASAGQLGGKQPGKGAPSGGPGGAIAAGPKAGGKPGGAAGKPPVTMVPIYPSLGRMFLRSQATVTIYGYLPVVPMTIGSALLMILVSLLTRPPSRATIDKYFSSATTPTPDPEPEKVLT